MTEKEYVIKRLKQIAKEGRIKTEWVRKAGLYYAVIKHWGSIKKMQEDLKMPLQTRNRKINIDKHVEKLVEFIKKNKRFPRKKEMGYTYYVLKYRQDVAGKIIKEVSMQVKIPQKIIKKYSIIEMDKNIKKRLQKIRRDKEKINKIKEKILKKKAYSLLNRARHDIVCMNYISRTLKEIDKRSIKKIIRYIAKYIDIEHIYGGYFLSQYSIYL